jgi:hypothetical protein
MTRVATLVGAGVPPSAAQATVGFNSIGVSGAGSSSQANSTLIQASNTFVSTNGSGGGVRLPTGASPGDSFFIYNGGANTLNIYPPVGGAINGGSVDATYTAATLTAVAGRCISADGLNFAFVKGA